MENSALVIIDIQKGEAPYLVKTEQLISNINGILEKARKKGMHILFTKHINSDKEKKKFATVRTEKGTEGSELADGLNIIDNDRIFEKEEYSIFSNSEIKEYLEHNDVKKLFLCGISAHVCVLLSSADAFAQNYDVYVIKECVGGKVQEKIDFALDWMNTYTASVIPLTDL